MDQNYFSSFVIALCCGTVIESVDSARLTSVSNYGQPLFEEMTNHGGVPIDEDPRIRERVCEDISSSGLFELTGMTLIDAREIYDNRHQEKYASIYRKIFSELHYKYVNSYRAWSLTSISSGRVSDVHVFVCPFEDVSDNSFRFYNVTKEYHVGATDEPYKPGRFLFGKPIRSSHVIYVLLAEEPALWYSGIEPEFNVELYYLRLRKYVKPAENNSMDPLCRLIGGERPKDQHLRFCTAVLKSSYFEEYLRYPDGVIVDENRCFTEYVTFKTTQGTEEANGRSFYERMILCRSTYRDSSGEIHLYVSRGYMSNQVFVYVKNLDDGNIYLENLSTNIAIRDELNSFDFPEV